MQQQKQSPPQAAQGTGQALGEMIEGVARSICLTVEIFLHRGFGSRYIGCGFIGVCVMFAFSVFFKGDDPRPLLGFTMVYGSLWLIATVSMLIRCWRGKDRVHSRYTGRPYLWRLLPTWREENFKNLEALAVILLGFGLHYLSRPLGDYLMMAASLLFLRGYNLAVQQRDRAVAMNDLVIEEQIVADRFRDMQGQ